MGRSIINQRSINKAHNVNPALIFKAMASCKEPFISTKYFFKVGMDTKPESVELSIGRATIDTIFYFLCFFLPSRNMKQE